MSPRQLTPLPTTAKPTSQQLTTPPIQTFPHRQLKLYWEEGYNWQEEYFERKWCMMFDYDGYPGTGRCWYGTEIRPCNPDQVYVAKCGTDPRQRFDLELLPPNDENEELFMIRIPSKGSCLELDDRAVFIRPCNPLNYLQHWKTINGNLSGRRFEMVPVSRTSHCITQAHHPKPGEVVETYRCTIARSPTHLTSFWNLYG